MSRGFQWAFGGYTAPLVWAAVVRVSTTVFTADRAILGHNTGAAPTPVVGLGVQGAAGFGQSPQISVGTRCLGDEINDGQWHVVVGVITDATSSSIYMDGRLVGVLSGSAGSNGVYGIGLGSCPDGTRPFDGDIARAMLLNGRMSRGRLADLSAMLGKRYGITTTRAARGPFYRDITTGSGDALRVYLPGGVALGDVSTTRPVVLLNHQSGGSSQVDFNFQSYTLIDAFLSEGWAVALPNGHGEHWGNAAAQSDITSADTYLRANVSTGPRFVVGYSMGGTLVAATVANGLLTNLKGALTIDGVLALLPMYRNSSYRANIATAYGITSGTLSSATTAGATSIPTTAAFPTVGTQLIVGVNTANEEIVTTTSASSGTAVAVTTTTKNHGSGEAVSDFPSKTTGFDPLARGASAYGTTVPWRLIASSNDGIVAKTANTDPFQAMLGAVPEKAIVTHNGGHIPADAFKPGDAVAFMKRYLP